MESKITIIDILVRLSGKEQKEIAQIIGVTESTISDAKTGKRDIAFGKFVMWCKLLDVNPYNVIDEYFKVQRVEK